MPEAQSPIAYCTNVLAGANWSEMKANVTRCTADVRRLLRTDRSLAIGLWLSAATAREIIAQNATEQLRAWLADNRLTCVTLNGFPYGDFHGEVVKHRVYEPPWDDVRRRDYTLDLARILNAVLPAGARASISTLPVGWGTRDLAQAAGHLHDIAEHLASSAVANERHITIDLEPEPGCVLQDSGDVLRFFDNHVPKHRDHIGVCHDICHTAVMFEDQAAVLARYAEAGIAVNKIQVSSAIEVDFDACAAAERSGLRAQLNRFSEPRYLHQTTVCDSNGPLRFYEDLAPALRAETDAGRWRIHFHVPIDHERIGLLATTAGDIPLALTAAPAESILEIETYAWSVLPAEHRAGTLPACIAREIGWLTDVLEQRTGD